MSDPAPSQATSDAPQTKRQQFDAKMAEGKVKMAEGKVKATEMIEKGVAKVPHFWDVQLRKVCCAEVRAHACVRARLPDRSE